MGCRLAGSIGVAFLLFLQPFVQTRHVASLQDRLGSGQVFGLSLASAYEAMEVKGGGTIVGVVKVTGEVGERESLEVFKHKEVCGEQVPDESLVVGPGKGLRYAVVTLEGITRGRAVELEAVNILDNQACRFVPHVQAASTGQWLELRNSDPILHNADAHLNTEKALFNVALPPGRQTRKPLAYPGVMQVTCNVRHTWMNAYLIVTEHPYHAVTDLYGEYEIREVPPGTYKLKVWHELLGVQEKEVRVEAGKEVKVDFTLPMKEPEGEDERAAGGIVAEKALAFGPGDRPGPLAASGRFDTLRTGLAAEGMGVITGSVTIGGKVEPHIKDAVISVEGVPATLIPQERIAAEKKAQIDQKDMTFVPHVLPVLVGTTVDFPNSDPVYHNVFSVSAVKKFDLGLYPQGETRSTTFDKPGVAAIRCNTHPKMEAYIVVKEHPYFTVPNERGIYQLTGVPLGSYTIQAWHPKLGTITQPVTLERSGEVLSVNFDLEKAR